MAFKVDAQLHFLTYPQCELSKERILEVIKQKYGNKYGWSVICAEDHAPKETPKGLSHGGVHRHVMVYSNSRFKTQNQRFWDIDDFHPHYESVRYKAKCLEYVMKDGDYIYDGTYNDAPFTPELYLEANSKKQSYGMTYVAMEIKAGKTIDELDEVVPGMVYRDKRKIEEYIKYQEEKKIRLTPKPLFPGFKDAVPKDRPLLPSESDLEEWQKIIDWANLNFTQPRQRRQKQLWIYGPHGIGKSVPWDTTIIPYKTMYSWNYDNRQTEELDTADFILMDEMNGGVTLSFFKLFSQMSGTARVTYRYGKLITFDRNVPLVVVSNVHPDEIYVNAKLEDREAIKDRFTFANPQFPYYLELKEPEQPRIEEDHSEHSNQEHEQENNSLLEDSTE